MDVALEGVQLGILFNQGQVCSAGSRIFVQESFYDEFVEKVVEAFKKLKLETHLTLKHKWELKQAQVNLERF